MEYQDSALRRVEAAVVSAQHDPDVYMDDLRRDIERCVIREALPAGLLDGGTRILINPTARFVLGGPAADTGLTGRKIIADTYGGYARHGGGAFSGKDPSKVDRSAAYMARHIAKSIVALGIAHRREIQSGRRSRQNATSDFSGSAFRTFGRCTQSPYSDSNWF